VYFFTFILRISNDLTWFTKHWQFFHNHSINVNKQMNNAYHSCSTKNRFFTSCDMSTPHGPKPKQNVPILLS
jgi:hypothetical protein